MSNPRKALAIAGGMACAAGARGVLVGAEVIAPAALLPWWVRQRREA